MAAEAAPALQILLLLLLLLLVALEGEVSLAAVLGEGGLCVTSAENTSSAR